jgi:aryl sulfotransferase
MILDDHSRQKHSEKPADALFREVREVSDHHLLTASFDISRNAMLALVSILLNDGRAGDLAKTLGITDAMALDLVSGLIQSGYAEHSGNGRRLIRITNRGNAVLKAVRGAIATARWTDFPFRQGDIVISTSAKSGTTWAQMICALLIFRTPDPPAPLSELSPWLDWILNPRDKVYGQPAAQDHRRFIKTHMSLNEIAIDPRATYIVVARHPLDIAVSMYHHDNNIDTERFRQLAGISDIESHGTSTSSPHKWLVDWFDESATPQGTPMSLPGIIWHLSQAWTRRDQPNVVLLHYDDLSADLDGEMRRVAKRLGISVPEDMWPGLVRAATFDQMRHAADRLQPVPNVLKDNAAFFHSGTSGSGRELLTAAELDRYHARVRKLASPGLLAWLHRN